MKDAIRNLVLINFEPTALISAIGEEIESRIDYAALAADFCETWDDEIQEAIDDLLLSTVRDTARDLPY